MAAYFIVYTFILLLQKLEDLKNLYDYEICKEIEVYAKELQEKGEAVI